MSFDGAMARISAIESKIGNLSTLAGGAAPAAGDGAAVDRSTRSPSGVSNSEIFTQELSKVLGGAAGNTDVSNLSEKHVSSRVTGSQLVESAKKYLGVPYVWGGESPSGVDCSGLVQLALKDLGITNIPRVARDQMRLGDEVKSLAEARPGDLVVLKHGKHIGIYVGDGKMIDAPKPGKQVVIRDVYETPTTIRRILPNG